MKHHDIYVHKAIYQKGNDAAFPNVTFQMKIDEGNKTEEMYI